MNNQPFQFCFAAAEQYWRPSWLSGEAMHSSWDNASNEYLAKNGRRPDQPSSSTLARRVCVQRPSSSPVLSASTSTRSTRSTKRPLAPLKQRGHGDGVVPPRSASEPYIRCFFLGSSATCTKRKTESVVLLLSFLCPCELLPCVGVFLRSLQTLPNTGTVILSLEGPSGQTRACPTVRLAVGLTSTRARSRGR